MTSPARMGQHERLPGVQRRIAERGSARIDELATAFEVSEMTIRRDLDELAIRGLVRRVRGGAVAVGPEPFSERHQHHTRAKGRIADKLVPMVPAQGTIALDASSTLYRLAGKLEGAQDLLVATNGLDTFEILDGRPGVSVTLTGGTREPRTGSLVGPAAVRTAESFLFDVFMTSAAALDSAVGSSEASVADAEVKRALTTASSRVILAVDSSKLESRAPARMFRLDAIDVLVTELDPSDERLAPYQAAGIEVY